MLQKVFEQKFQVLLLLVDFSKVESSLSSSGLSLLSNYEMSDALRKAKFRQILYWCWCTSLQKMLSDLFHMYFIQCYGHLLHRILQNLGETVTVLVE